MSRTLLAFFILPLISTPMHAQETDLDTGLVLADGWETVRGVCLECHTAQMITQNAGNQAVWKSRINWMQDTQGLQQLAPEVEATILAYLAANYGPRQASRRPAIAAELMPENPYPVNY